MTSDESGLCVVRATGKDVTEIVNLMNSVQRSGGAGLSQTMPADLVRDFVETMPCVIVRRDERLLGALIVHRKPRGNEAGPVTAAMLRAYPGDGDAYVYGPVAVVPSERGRGIAQRMFAYLRTILPGREGILFISPHNAASVRAHEKMGAVTVGRFTANGNEFLVLSLR